MLERIFYDEGRAGSCPVVDGEWGKCNVPLRLQNFALRQHSCYQWLHAEVCGDGDGFVLEFGDLFAIAVFIAFNEKLGVVEACPAKFGAVAGVGAEFEGFLEVRHGIIRVTKAVGQHSQTVITRYWDAADE